MKVVLYARVSSEKQAENDLSISAQLKSLRKYAAQKGFVIYKEFVDEAESARSANRPAFQEMIAFAKRKPKLFDAILIWNHSRFARNREDAIIYKSLLRKRGISVLSMNEHVDDSPAGKLLEGIIEVIDEFYSLNLAEDTIRGLRENASRGFQNGSIPVGYVASKVQDGSTQRTTLQKDALFAPIIKRIFDLYLQGNGIKEIAKTLNAEGLNTHRGCLWSTSTISYILKNEAYMGTLVYGKKTAHPPSNKENASLIRRPNDHPLIVSEDDFLRVQELMKTRAPIINHPRELTSRYLLSGRIHCGKCGGKMIGSSAKAGKYLYYECVNYIKRGKKACDAKFVRKHLIEGILIKRINTHVLTKERLKALLDIVIKEAKHHKKDMEVQVNTLENHTLVKTTP